MREPALRRHLQERLTASYRLLCCLGLAVPAKASQGACSTEWISKTATGQPAWGDCEQSALSTDARFVAFSSWASNLVPGDTNGVSDIFVVDRLSSTVERVSEGTGGIQGNDFSLFPDISGDGRYVVFVSKSTNWDPRDTDPGYDVYLHDRLTKTTEFITVHLAPPNPPPYSGSEYPKISADGRFLVFAHLEDNLVPGDSNGKGDAFLHDRANGVTELVSVNTLGAQANFQSGRPVLSDDGRYVAFVSEASNWYPGNTVGIGPRAYIYVRDRQLNTLTPVNLNPSGSLGPGYAGYDIDLSADGRFLVYPYYALVSSPIKELTPMSMTELYLRDLVTGISEPIGYGVLGNHNRLGTLSPGHASISSDGRFVAFQSTLDYHVLHSGNTGGTNVFVQDRLTGLIQVASLGPNGQWPSLPPQTGAEAMYPSISPDGNAISFVCEDPTFGSGNALFNVYLRMCDWTQPQVYCDSKASSFGCRPSISFSGSPSASVGVGFTVQAHGIINNTTGMFFYSTTRPILTPFHGSYLCMDPPRRRLAVQNSGGGLPSSCTGNLSVDFNAWIAGGGDPSLVFGENVCIQAWSRDAGSLWGSNLSNAVAFVIGL